MAEIKKYRPVVFVAGGEDGVCGGRFFEARRALGGWNIVEAVAAERIDCGIAANLGEINRVIERRVNGGC